MLTEEQRTENRRRSILAEANAKKVLKPGDRLRVTKCPGTKRGITFAEWDGHWIVSKSGINDYSPLCVDRLNGEAVNFTKTPNVLLCRAGHENDRKHGALSPASARTTS